MDGKVSTGIEGLDEMLGGGFPQGHNVVTMGSFGTGKTSFGLQFIWKGLQEGDPCIFISLEEDSESITKSAANYGWDIKPFLDGRQLVIVKLEPADAKDTVTRIKSELPQFIQSYGAKRIVIDSISLLTMMFHEEAEKRQQLFNLVQTIKKTGATSLFTAEVDANNPRASRDGLPEYTADGVILLTYNEGRSGEVQLTIRVVKMRRSQHSRGIKPYSITDSGLVVHIDAEVF